MPVHYVLIDYENVQPASLAGLEAERFRVLVFLGEHQNKLNFAFVDAMQKLGERAEYVKMAGSGHNALDLHIALHIGQLLAKDPTACFHIVSKDTDFDPLVRHLKERKVHAQRVPDIATISPAKNAVPKSDADRIAEVLSNLRQRGASRPRTVKTLKSTVAALFHKQLEEKEVDSILGTLQAKGFVIVDGLKVSYALPD